MTTIVRTSITSLLLLLVFYDHATGLIIPEELPTILSLIYSNIPPIKKGTDSRLGVGFRLGEHADFQVLIELGPQTETDPIGTGNSKRRRDAMLTAAIRGEYGPLTQAMVKYQMERKIQSVLKKLQEEQLKKIQTANKTSDQDTTSDNWLTRWQQEMSSEQLQKNNVSLSPVEDQNDQNDQNNQNDQKDQNNQNDQKAQQRIGKPPAKPVPQKDKLAELTKLYKSQNANTGGNAA